MVDRLRQIVRALRGFRRFPVAAALIAEGDGHGLADYLRRKAPEAGRATLVGLARAEGLVIEFTRAGLRWRVDVGDEIGEQLYLTGAYEGEEIAAVLRWLERKDGVIVDAGANVGTTSIPLAQAGYRVVAIEPVPDTFEMLSWNVSRNGFGRQITCAFQAVSEQVGTIDMWTGCGSGQAEVAVDGKDPALLRWGDAVRRVSVPTGPLDVLLARLEIEPGDVALVWADVQGSETAVIRTGTRLWGAGVPAYLEVDPASLELHAGVTAFIAEIRSHFTRFIPRDDLIAGRPATPIEGVARWVATIGAEDYSDALFVP